jgi:hypothetical protein
MKREGDREVNVPVERESEMEAFYINEARENRMSIRSWFRFLLQERFKFQIGEIPYSPYWPNSAQVAINKANDIRIEENLKEFLDEERMSKNVEEFTESNQEEWARNLDDVNRFIESNDRMQRIHGTLSNPLDAFGDPD